MIQRLATVAVALPVALMAVFWLPPGGFLLLIVVLMEWGVVEYVRLTRPASPGGPLNLLLLAVPAVSLALTAGGWGLEHNGLEALFVAGTVLSVAVGVSVLWARTPIRDALAALGVLAYGLPYFVAPIVSLYWLKVRDPWLLFLLVAVVWLGDSAAFFIGSRWGRRPLASIVSPNKTWEGAGASLLVAMVAGATWSFFRLGEVRLSLLWVVAAVAAAAQVGDLVESVLKRGAGVKDSGELFPGHGGVLDRMDALLFAAPVLVVGLWLAGGQVLAP